MGTITLHIDWNAMRDRAYANATKHGFHDKAESVEHDLCLVFTELCEAVNADRSGLRADKAEFLEKYIWDRTEEYQRRHWRYGFECLIKDTLEDELADAIIRMLDICGYLQIDLADSEMDYYMEDERQISSVFQKKTFAERIWSVMSLFFYNDPYSATLPRAIARLWILAKDKGVDIYTHLELKMKYNEMRPRLHGKKY